MWLQNALSLLSPGWVGSLIGLVGLLAAILVYVLTRQRTSFGYALSGERLLGLSADGLPSQITVQYNGENIPRLTRSLVVLWNNAENTLLGENITELDPLRFSVGPDGIILSVTVLKASRPVNDFRVMPPTAHTPDEASFSFNYLDANDGAVVEILHTSDLRLISVLGTMRGLPKGLKYFGRIIRRNNGRSEGAARALNLMTTWIPLIIGTVISLVGTFVPSDTLTEHLSQVPQNISSVIVAAGTFYALLGLAMFYILRRKHPKRLHIDALD